MTVEIKPNGVVFKDKDGKAWLPVVVSFEALRQINKIVLGDKVDKDNFEQLAKRRQIHEDVLELMDLLRVN